MKVGLICDTHVGIEENSPQYAFLLKAVGQMKGDGIDTIIHLGDVIGCANKEVYKSCVSILSQFNNCHILIGNHDVTNKSDKDEILSLAKDVLFKVDDKTFLGLHLTSNVISKGDFEKIETLKDGDVLLMHYGVHSLSDEIREKLSNILSNKSLTVICAHSHKKFDYNIGKSRVVGLRALDPDKSIGDYPCITYFDTKTNEFTEKVFKEKRENLIEISKYLGFSLANNKEDLAFAMDNDIKAIELKLSSVETDFDNELEALIEKYNKKVGGYLSVHMPDIKFDGKEYQGKEAWLNVLEIVKRIKTNGITVHPPKIKKSLLLGNNGLLDEIVDFYAKAFQTLNKAVKIGFENIHMLKQEKDLPIEECGFGYTPNDLFLLRDKVNEKMGADRANIVLDVGHTKNNGNLSSIYTISRWLSEVGDKTVAYHIHQVIKTEDGLKNHNAIENWFGPLISYASFFYAFSENIIKRVPIFIEVRGKDNYVKSIEAFNKLIK